MIISRPRDTKIFSGSCIFSHSSGLNRMYTRAAGETAALLDPDAYQNGYPACGINSADTNADGSIDLTDVEPFIDLLLG